MKFVSNAAVEVYVSDDEIYTVVHTGTCKRQTPSRGLCTCITILMASSGIRISFSINRVTYFSSRDLAEAKMPGPSAHSEQRGPSDELLRDPQPNCKKGTDI